MNGRAVKQDKQGNRLSAFGHGTFLIPVAFDAGPYRFPFAVCKLKPVMNNDYLRSASIIGQVRLIPGMDR